MKSTRYFSFSTFFTGFGSFSFFLLIPILIDRSGFGLSNIGIVLTSYSVAVLIFSPLWGILSDRFGRRKVFLVLGYAIFSASSFLYIFADTLPQLMALRFFQGLGFAAHPMLTALFSDTLGQKASRQFGNLSGAEALGWGLGSLTAGFIADQIGIRLTFGLIAIFPLISASIVLLKLPESKPESTTVSANTQQRFPKKLFYLYATIFVRQGAAIALWSMLPIFLLMFVDSLALVGAVNAVNMLTQPVLMLIIGKYSERLGRLRLVMWGIMGTIVTFWVYASASHVWHVVLGQLMISLAWAAIVIGMNTYIMSTAPQGMRGKAFGYLQGSITVAMAIGPLLGGTLSEQVGIRSMIFIVSLLMLLSLPFLLRLKYIEKRQVHRDFIGEG